MNSIDKCFFPMNVEAFANAFMEAEHHRREWTRRTAPEGWQAEPYERKESSIAHHAEMWARYCEQMATNWRTISEASGYCKDDAN